VEITINFGDTQEGHGVTPSAPVAGESVPTFFSDKTRKSYLKSLEGAIGAKDAKKVARRLGHQHIVYLSKT